ncbi:MAG: hypothetical protein SF182_23820 [Deltaproteobacteria bacterium]|nr:hypothetical protein [Deltaproteobacteria bacterium]
MTGLLFACGGFLAAVLWFDLMFDVQVRPYSSGDLPEPVLASIAGYYRRVTTDAAPMTYAVALVMVLGLVCLLAQLIDGAVSRWISLLSLLLVGGAVGLAARVVPNAIRLGSRRDPIAEQSSLARRIYRDHVRCLVAIGVFLLLQLAA